MAIISLRQLLDHAGENNYGVPAFNVNNLEQIRKSCGLTQQELSMKAEVSRKSINAIENGVYVPSTVLALKISKTLNCSVEDLFTLP